ncbi:hypothetical protein ACWCQ4_23680, partial [Streptomyces aureus]
MTTTPDVDLTALVPGRHALRDRLLGLDSRIFEAVAARHWPGGDPVLPRLSRSANHGLLWFATAAAVAASRTPRARRAAVRGKDSPMRGTDPDGKRRRSSPWVSRATRCWHW